MKTISIFLLIFMLGACSQPANDNKSDKTVKGREAGQVVESEQHTNDDSETGELYEQVGISEKSNQELAEVLSVAEADTTFRLNDYSVRVYLVCNGPADTNIDGCNCTHYAYLAMSTVDMPYNYKLFKVGPFYLAKFGDWHGSGKQGELTIEHEIRGWATKTFIKTTEFGKITVSNIRL